MICKYKRWWISGLLLLLAGCAPVSLEVVQVINQPLVVEEVFLPVTSANQEDSTHTVTVDRFDVDPSRFDGGKMWLFDSPPIDWLAEEYGINVDSAWLAKAKLGALRFGESCSASFVSDRGLILTNHHCAREWIMDVSVEGEDFLEDGFLADTVVQERKVPDLQVEQLLDIKDVTHRVHGASRIVRGDNERIQARRRKASEIADQLTETARMRDSTLQVDVVELYSGEHYAAYTYKIYEDIRLVMAPEKEMGYFGGEYDNFTFPRYTLDMAFFRAYDQNGAPVITPDHYVWNREGAMAGDVVFVIGNPGSTSRSGSVSQLLFERDYTLAHQVKALERRADLLRPYTDMAALDPTWFRVSNTLKALSGQLAGLRNDTLIARRSAGEHQIKEDLFKSDSLSGLYGNLFQELDELQLSKRAEAERMAAFTFFGTSIGSRILTRALYGYYYGSLQRRGYIEPEVIDEVRSDALALKNMPVAVDKELIALRFEEIRCALGEKDPTVRSLLEGRSMDSLVTDIVTTTALSDSAGFATLLEEGFLGSTDPIVPIISALAPLYFNAQQQAQSFKNREDLLIAELASLRFALYGTDVPPDASSSLRISDGYVRGYAYNGTHASAFTTFYGLYDHYHAYEDVHGAWNLPERWQNPPDTFDLSTPLNLVSTNDIAGGNSGSPLLNQDLEIVGLVFDGNIESLSNVYAFSDIVARTVSVDVRAILSSLQHIYGAKHLVNEITKAE